MVNIIKNSVWVFLLTASIAVAQNKRVDSLKSLLSSAGQDTNRVVLLNKLADDLRVKDPGTAADYAKESIALSQKLNYVQGRAMAAYLLGNTATNLRKFVEAEEYLAAALDLCSKSHPAILEGRIYNNLGIISEMKNNYSHASVYYGKALESFTIAGDKKKMAACRFNIGNIYRYMGNYPMALQYHFAALREREIGNDNPGIAASLNSIGLIYKEQNDLAAALNTYLRALKVNKEAGNPSNEILLNNNIGVIYREKGDYSRAMSYFNAALKICKEVNYTAGIADAFVNIGNLAKDKGNTKDALDNFTKALAIHQQSGDSNGIALCYGCLSTVCMQSKQYPEAIEYAESCLTLANHLGLAEFSLSAEEVLYRAFTVRKEYKNALDHYQAYISLRDTLYNEANTKKTVQAQMNYEFDKKEAAAKLDQEKKEAVAEAESKKQRIILLGISGFGLLVLVFAIYAYRSFIQKRNANIEITLQKHVIEEKQKEILDSIYYARRIQRSLLTSEKYIGRVLSKLRLA